MRRTRERDGMAHARSGVVDGDVAGNSGAASNRVPLHPAAPPRPPSGEPASHPARSGGPARELSACWARSVYSRRLNRNPRRIRHKRMKYTGVLFLGFASAQAQTTPCLGCTHAAVRIRRFRVLHISIQSSTLQRLSAGVSRAVALPTLVGDRSPLSWCVMSHVSPALVHPGAAGAGRDGALRGRGVQAPQESAAQGRLQTRGRAIGHGAPAAVAGDGLRTNAARIR
jgi:hypothetical protein